MVNKRSPQALTRREEQRLQRIEASKFIREQCTWFDHIIKETVNIHDRETIVTFLSEEIEGFYPCTVTVEEGEVLIDKYGRGSWQLPRNVQTEFEGGIT